MRFTEMMASFVTFVFFIFRGLAPVSTVGYFVIIILSGVVLGRWAAYLFAGLNLLPIWLCCLAISYDIWAWTNAKPISFLDKDVILVSVGFLVVAWLVDMIDQNFRKVIEEIFTDKDHSIAPDAEFDKLKLHFEREAAKQHLMD